MALVDKPDFKTGFWIGLGVILAFAAWGLFNLFAMKAVERYR